MSPGDSEPRLDAVGELVERCLARLSADGADPVAEVCAPSPELEPAVRRRLEMLRDSGLLGEEDARRAVPERLGEFRIESFLGGGGMGVVYRAVQEPLERRVALKLVRPDLLYFPGARERFRREVAVVARLAHPGIVPVHTFGEQDGLPYFAMEEVRGCTLAEALLETADVPLAERTGATLRAAIARRAAARGDEPADDEPPPLFTGTWAEACARIVRQIAAALDHAHREGVLHRDVKPSNVLVTLDGRALVFDFGLSRDGGVGAETRSGALLGSLPYMAPELLDGGSADRRTDVYALGVTAYELLCGERPYGARTAPELQSAVLAGRAAPLRGKGLALPADLETVVATAMAAEAERRYPTAGDLARDVDNVLELRPIAARPATRWLVVRRWCRRNPGAAAAVALGALLAVGTPTAVAVQRSLANREIRSALASAEDERARAEESLDRAVAAALGLLAEVGDSDLEHVPGMELKRRSLLERALSQLDAVAELRAGDPALAASRARVRVQAARVHDLLGDLDRGAAELAAAEAVLRALPGERSLLAECLAARAANAQRRGQTAAALELDGEVERILLALIADAPGDAALVERLAQLAHGIGSLSRELGRLDDAADAFAESLERAERLVDLAARSDPAGPATARAARLAGRAGTGLALARYDAGRLDEAAERFAAADAWLVHAIELGSLEARMDTLTCAKNRAVALLDLGRFDELEDVGLRGVEVGRGLARELPFTFEVREELASLERNLAISLHVQGRPEEALLGFRRSVDTYVELEQLAPASFHVRQLLAGARSNLANIENDFGEPEQAAAHADAAVAGYAALRAERPDDERLRHDQISGAMVAAAAHALCGRYPEPGSLAALVDAELPDDPVAHLLAACAHARAAAALEIDPSLGEARRDALRAEQIAAALASLERSFENGLPGIESLPSTAPELGPLLELDEYRDLAARYGG
jgi:hypothetical protein